MTTSPAALAEAHRLFFAILPPPDVATVIGGQRTATGVTRSVVADHRLHITLGLSHDYAEGLPAQLIVAAMEAGGSLRADPFRMVLDQAIGAGGSLALRASEPLPDLILFQQQLATALDQSDFPMRTDWNFNPHVTLGYRKGAPFVEPMQPICWRVTDFALIHSHVGLTCHDLLARWALTPR